MSLHTQILYLVFINEAAVLLIKMIYPKTVDSGEYICLLSRTMSS